MQFMQDIYSNEVIHENVHFDFTLHQQMFYDRLVVSFIVACGLEKKSLSGFIDEPAPFPNEYTKEI